MDDVYLLSSKPYDFEGYKGFTNTFSKDGSVFKLSGKVDLRPILEKSKGVPVLGNLDYTVEVRGGYLKPVFQLFKAR